MIDETVNIYVNLLGRSGYHVNTVTTKKTVLNNFTAYLNENSITDLKEIDITVIENFLSN